VGLMIELMCDSFGSVIETRRFIKEANG